MVRVRFDTAWLFPTVPVDSFPNTSIYVPGMYGKSRILPYDSNFIGNYFPINDQFALLPRPLASAYFSAVHSFYDLPCADSYCLDSKGRYKYNECLLWKHLRDQHAPVVFYDFFVFTIVRVQEGAMCNLINPHFTMCGLIERAAGFQNCAKILLTPH